MSEFEYRFFDKDKYYDNYIGFWNEHKKLAPNKSQLSDLGIAILKDEKLCAATFVYFSNSGMAQIAFTAANPNIGPKAKIKAVIMALGIAEDIIKQKGYKYIHTFSDMTALTKLFKRKKFVQLKQHDFLIKELGG